MLVLTITDDKQPCVLEVHLLQPGEHFTPFGGSKSGLCVGKTPSLVTREVSPWGTRDIERDIHDPFFWNMISNLINGQSEGVTAKATQPVALTTAVVLEEEGE